MRKYTDIELDEIRADARNLEHSVALSYVFDKLQDECIQQLTESPIGELTSMQLHARLKAIGEIRRELDLTKQIGRTMTRGR